MSGRETTPRPAAQPDPGGVLVDVLGHVREMLVAVEHAGVEAALKEVAGACVAAVEAHRVDAVQALHPARELGLRRLDEQVEVVVEQVPRMEPPAEPLRHLDEQLEPRLAVAVVEDDRPLLHAAARHVVVGRAGQLGPWDSGHGLDASGLSAGAKPA